MHNGGEVVLIIGDVHGELSLLEGLLENVQDQDVYFVGDVIDRGKFGVETLKFIKSNKFKVVLGNHEDMMLKYLKNKDPYYREHWFYNGGNKTLKDFKRLRSKEQQNITEYLDDLPYYYYIEENDLLISHAGVNGLKGIGLCNLKNKNNMECKSYTNYLKAFLSNQTPSDFLWSRGEEFINNKVIDEFPTIFVAGHTITSVINQNINDATVLRLNNRIMIDCGAFCNGVLGSIQIINNNIIAHYYSKEKGYYSQEFGKLR